MHTCFELGRYKTCLLDIPIPETSFRHHLHQEMEGALQPLGVWRCTKLLRLYLLASGLCNEVLEFLRGCRVQAGTSLVTCEGSMVFLLGNTNRFSFLNYQFNKVKRQLLTQTTCLIT